MPPIRSKLPSLPAESVVHVLRGALIGMDLALQDAERFRRKAVSALDELAGRQGSPEPGQDGSGHVNEPAELPQGKESDDNDIQQPMRHTRLRPRRDAGRSLLELLKGPHK